MERTTEKSDIVYLGVCKDPAENGNTMQRVLDFLSEMFDVGKVLKHLVVVGDAKTYEYLRKLKHQYRPALNWMFPFPGGLAHLQKLSKNADENLLACWL